MIRETPRAQSRQPPGGEAGSAHSRFRKTIGLAIYVLCVAASLEAFARFALSTEAVASRVRGRSDAAWRLEWTERHERGIQIYLPIDVHHPTRGWATRPHLRGEGTFGPGSVSSNSLGLRGAREFDDAGPPEKQRILLLGDSFTFGEEVRDTETFAHQLQLLHPEAEILNLGVHGYGHDQMLVLFREIGRSLRPDLVVVGFVRDDMARNLLEFRDFAKPRFELDAGNLRLKNVPVPTPEEVIRAELLRPRLLDLADMLWEAYRWKVGINQRRMEELTPALLDAIVEEAVQAGAVTVFAYLPHSEEIDFPEITLEGEEFFTDYCRRRAAFCVNLRPAFLSHVEAGYPIKTPGHWHANGHRLVAEELGRYLTERRLLGS